MSEEAIAIVDHLAQQAQLLATLKTLGTLHVFTSIPFDRVADIQDVAHVLCLPSDYLLRLIRFVATSGFLHEPHPGFVEHTALSTQLVRKPFLLDAIKFISDTALPAALRAAPPPGDSLCDQKESTGKWKRQVDAYHRLRQDAMEASVAEILSDMQWADLGNATVVQICPPSLATARKLASENPNLTFIVQQQQQLPEKKSLESTACKSRFKASPSETTNPDHLPKITTAHRARGDAQTVKDAHVYILHLPGPSLLSQNPSETSAAISQEIRIHCDILRGNPEAKFLLVAELLPGPGTLETKAEVAARTHDLFLRQLTNGGGGAAGAGAGLFDIEQLQDIVKKAGDEEKGRLHIAKYMPSRHMPVTVAQVMMVNGNARGGGCC